MLKRCIYNPLLCSQCFMRLCRSSVQAPPRGSLGASVLCPRVRFQFAMTGLLEAPVTFLDVCLVPACAREGVCAERTFLLEITHGSGACGGDRIIGLLENAPYPVTVCSPPLWCSLTGGHGLALLPCLPASLPAAPPVGAGVWCSVVSAKGFENQDEQNNRTQGSQCKCSQDTSVTVREEPHGSSLEEPRVRGRLKKSPQGPWPGS